MQQKVALAAAMLNRPDILLLDEPTLGLDVHSSKTIEQTIKKLAAEEGKTILLTTHQMALAEKLCDQIFVIHQGKKVAEGSTGKVVQQFGGHQQTVEIQLDAIINEVTLTCLQDSFPTLSANVKNGKTILAWSDHVSQSEVLKLMNVLNDEGLTILQMGQREATLEEVFVKLTSDGIMS
jgi:ABC-2 type transport system ATP-binding protein